MFDSAVDHTWNIINPVAAGDVVVIRFRRHAGAGYEAGPLESLRVNAGKTQALPAKRWFHALRGIHCDDHIRTPIVYDKGRFPDLFAADEMESARAINGDPFFRQRHFAPILITPFGIGMTAADADSRYGAAAVAVEYPYSQMERRMLPLPFRLLYGLFCDYGRIGGLG